jgi:hypothetical protein
MKTKLKKRPKVKRNAVSSVSLADWAGLFGGAISPKLVKAVGREYAKVKNPSRAELGKIVRSMAPGSKRRPKSRPVGKRAKKTRRFVNSRGDVQRPRVRKTNPVDREAQVYREFHGRDPEEVITISEKIHVHDKLSGVGVLEFLVIDAVDGKSSVKLSGFKGALLAQDKEKRQLFIEGGDQSVNLNDFGIDPRKRHEQEVLGVATQIAYETRKDHLGEAGGAGERAVHVHPFGSKHGIDVSDPRRKSGSRLPIVLYDTRNRKLAFAGGGYDLPEVGIRG